MQDDTYSELLQALLEHPRMELTIDSSVSSGAVRKGLEKAIREYNKNATAMALLEVDVPQLIYVPSVSELDSGLRTKVKLLPPEDKYHTRYKPKFKFTIIDDSEE